MGNNQHEIYKDMANLQCGMYKLLGNIQGILCKENETIQRRIHNVHGKYPVLNIDHGKYLADSI